MIPQMLRELVPTDLIKTMSAADWKREIVRCYNQGKREDAIIYHFFPFFTQRSRKIKKSLGKKTREIK